MAKKQITTFLGSQKGLLTIGKHVYAYSTQGSSLTSSAYSTNLEFATGNEYIVGELTCYGPVDEGNPSSGAIANFRISYNGEILFFINLDSSAEDHPSQAIVPILIPPLTTVLIESSASASGWNPSVSILGMTHK